MTEGRRNALGMLIVAAGLILIYTIKPADTIMSYFEEPITVAKPEPLLCRWYSMKYMVTEYYDDKEKNVIVDTEYGRLFEYTQCSAYKGLSKNNTALGRKFTPGKKL